MKLTTRFFGLCAVLRLLAHLVYTLLIGLRNFESHAVINLAVLAQS